MINYNISIQEQSHARYEKSGSVIYNYSHKLKKINVHSFFSF